MKSLSIDKLLKSKIEKHFDFITQEYKVNTIPMWRYNFTDSDNSYISNLFRRTAVKKNYDVNIEYTFSVGHKPWRKKHSTCHLLYRIGYFDCELTNNSVNEHCNRYFLTNKGSSMYESIKLSLSIENTENPFNALAM